VSDRPTIRIWHENLSVLGDDGRLPLAALTPDGHIHGGLRIEIGGRLVPSLGFFGPDDVCFNEWLKQLWQVAQAFHSAERGEHTFDEGEQGQPAFVFERVGDAGFFTIADSGFDAGRANPEWQRIQFSVADFVAEHSRFRESLFATIRKSVRSAVADQWIETHDSKNQNG
jgi:hypothetical protein